MNSKWIDIVGLIFSLFGIVILSLGLIIPRKLDIKAGVSRLSEEKDEKNITLPHIRDRLRESRYALIGMVLLIIGFLLQIVGSILMS